MQNVKRHFKNNSICFLTLVTYKRRPILVHNFQLLWNSIEGVKKDFLFDLIAWVILHDHMHLLINPFDSNLPGLIRKIKLSFYGKLRHRSKNPIGRVWQNRYWDHVIRNENDLKNHIDYIHYNPVKHNMVNDPRYYEYSSFMDYLIKGYYTEGWGVIEKPDFTGQHGE